MPARHAAFIPITRAIRKARKDRPMSTNHASTIIELPMRPSAAPVSGRRFRLVRLTEPARRLAAAMQQARLGRRRDGRLVALNDNEPHGQSDLRLIRAKRARGS